MQRGFTIFEILLSLLVMSMIVVAGIEWANRKHEEVAAQQLGHRLYQYGLAATEYGRQNPDGYTSHNPPPDHFYGIAWLQDPNKPNHEMCRDPADLSTCETFLGHDFDFRFDSLKLAPLVGDNPDSIVHVVFERPTSAQVGPLRIQLVEVGKVYRYNKKKNEYDVDVSLDSRAINFANHFTDQNGSAQIFYVLTPLDVTGMITGAPFLASANVDSGYLRTDGSNEMDNTLRFSQTAGTKNIAGVEEIDFTNGRKFRGIVKTDYKVSSTGLSNGLTKPMLPVSNNTACFLTLDTRYWKDEHSTSREISCGLDQGNYNNTPHWILRANMIANVFTATCEAVCLDWGP